MFKYSENDFIVAIDSVTTAVIDMQKVKLNSERIIDIPQDLSTSYIINDVKTQITEIEKKIISLSTFMRDTVLNIQKTMLNIENAVYALPTLSSNLVIMNSLSELISESRELDNALYNNYTTDSIYKNYYGGDQGGPYYEYLNNLVNDPNNRNGVNNTYQKIINKYFPDYGVDETYDVLLSLNYVGCGYAALSNYIMEAYSGKEKEFEKDFGFPMYRYEYGNKIANTNYLETELFCKSYNEGINKYILEGRVHTEKIRKQKDETKNEVKNYYGLNQLSDSTTVFKLATGTQKEDLDKVLKSYSDIENINISESHNFNQNSINEIKNIISNGNPVLFEAKDYTLYDEYRNISTSIVDGNHWMTIVDVTSDNKYIISSWGRKYILDQESLDDDAQYYTINN